MDVKTREENKVLFVRVDRIGDLLLTLPAGSEWKKLRPNDRQVWLVNSAVDWIFEFQGDSTENVSVSIERKFFKRIESLMDLRKKLKYKGFSSAIVFHAPWWVTAAVWLAGIRNITGPASKWYSWLIFRNPIRQKRSLARKHESLYNVELVRRALGLPIEPMKPLPVLLQAKPQTQMKWHKIIKGTHASVVVLHPGMGGSARNWPAENYYALAKELIQREYFVVVTGSSIDRQFIDKTRVLTLTPLLDLVGKTTPDDLLAVLSLSNFVIAPSTGIIHLAAALQIPCLGIYSPLREQRPTRWAPLGDLSKTISPNVVCRGTSECLGSKCEFYDCMVTITPESIISMIPDQTHRSRRPAICLSTFSL